MRREELQYGADAQVEQFQVKSWISHCSFELRGDSSWKSDDAAFCAQEMMALRKKGYVEVLQGDAAKVAETNTRRPGRNLFAQNLVHSSS